MGLNYLFKFSNFPGIFFSPFSNASVCETYGVISHLSNGTINMKQIDQVVGRYLYILTSRRTAAIFQDSKNFKLSPKLNSILNRSKIIKLANYQNNHTGFGISTGLYLCVSTHWCTTQFNTANYIYSVLHCKNTYTIVII